MFLALATTIKYFPILLLPFILMYFFREQKPLKRFLKCMQYGIIFLGMLVIPYLIYIRNFEVMAGLFIQQEKLAKSLYVVVVEYFGNITNVIGNLKTVLLEIFVIIFIIVNLVWLNKNQIKFRKQMQIAQNFLIVFLFLLITNFQPWYILWLFPCIMWQKSENIKLIIGISIISEFANSIFLLNGEGWQNGIPFVFVMWTASLLYYIYLLKKKQRKFIKGKKDDRIYKEEQI